MKQSSAEELISIQSDLENLKKKISHQDGKLVLLTAQIEKQRIRLHQSSEQLQSTVVESKCKDEEILNLRDEVLDGKSQLRIANGKIHLLQYQLTKVQNEKVDLTAPIDETHAEVISRFLLNYSKFQKVLSEITDRTLMRSRLIRSENTASQQSLRTTKKLLKQSHDVQDSGGSKLKEFSLSSLILQKNESLLSLQLSEQNISDYSLNTTLEPHFLPNDSYKSTILRTPSLTEERVISRRIIPFETERFRTNNKNQKSPVSEVYKFAVPLHSSRPLRHDSDRAKDIQQSMRKEEFSMFTSPTTFRENISRIRDENEKLRKDIYKFRGKLEGMKSELNVIKHNIVK